MAETKAVVLPAGDGPRLPAAAVVEQIWKVLAAFASFGFCKAHAAAFALPTYQSAWLKAHYPAHFLSGVLTHDPGMYPKRLILDDARQFGIAVLGLDVNASEKTFVRGAASPEVLGGPARPAEACPRPGLRHPAGAVGGQGHLRGGGRPDRRGPALPLADRLLAPRPGVPAGRWSGWCWPAGSTRVYGIGVAALGRCAAAARHPARPAAPGGRPRPARPGGRPGQQGPGRGLASRGCTGRPGGGGRPGRGRGRQQLRRPGPDRQRDQQPTVAPAGLPTDASRGTGRPPAPEPAAGRGLGAGAPAVPGDPEGRAGDLGPARPRPRRHPGATARSAGCRR